MAFDQPAKQMHDQSHSQENGDFQHQVMEGLRVNLTPAPPMRRFLALCTDIGLISVVYYALGILFLILFASLGIGISALTKGSAVAGVGAIVFLILFLLVMVVVYHAYFIYYEHKTGTTPGKKLFGLRIVSVDGARLTMSQVVIRELLRSYVDIPLIFPALISIFSTEKKQRIGDLAANTMCVYSRSREDEQQYMYVKQEEYLLLMEYAKPGPVPHDFREAFLQFAYNEFVVRTNPAPIEYLDNWTQQVKKLLPEADNLGLNQQTVLRFFAEYCFQTLNKETAENRKRETKNTVATSTRGVSDGQ